MDEKNREYDNPNADILYDPKGIPNFNRYYLNTNKIEDRKNKDWGNTRLRTDRRLIAVIEKLGKKVGDVWIEEVPFGYDFHFDDDDGWETLETIKKDSKTLKKEAKQRKWDERMKKANQKKKILKL